MTPLNPRLYALLKERFGHVRVSNQGIAQVGVYRHDRLKGRDVYDLVEPGEYYAICCPMCNDTRFRLYINHMWGQRDEEGRCNYSMAICFNEDCLSTIERSDEFREMLFETMGGGLDNCRILEGKKAEPSDVRIDWPGPVTRVDQLPADHKAVQYLLSRRFDPEIIGRFYNVHYCRTSFRWLAQDRLIIPIYENKEMRGWQARYIGEINWKGHNALPKYYSCPGMPRRQLLYNIANASQYRTGIIVEGPTDVWRVGPMAVCTLGSTMTNLQQRKFVSAFRELAAVLLFDPDVYRDPKKLPAIEQLIAELRDKFDRGLAVVKLPDGTDPGGLDRQFLRDFVTSEAKAQGVAVSWKKR